MKTLGERIKFYRTVKGWTQEDIALKLDISRLSYSKIERNITDVTYSRLVQIAKALDISVSDLVSTPSKSSNQNEFQRMVSDKENEIIKLQKKIIELMERDKKKK